MKLKTDTFRGKMKAWVSAFIAACFIATIFFAWGMQGASGGCAPAANVVATVDGREVVYERMSPVAEHERNIRAAVQARGGRISREAVLTSINGRRSRV